MQTTFKLFFSFLFCFALLLMSGCGSGLTSAEQAEVDKMLSEHGTEALTWYLAYSNEEDEDRVLRSVKYLISKGADVNARGNNLPPFANNPLGLARYNKYDKVVKFLESKGAR